MEDDWSRFLLFGFSDCCSTQTFRSSIVCRSICSCRTKSHEVSNVECPPVVMCINNLQLPTFLVPPVCACYEDQKMEVSVLLSRYLRYSTLDWSRLEG